MRKTAKIWTGSNRSGCAKIADLLGTFTHYINGKQFRFIVTRFNFEVSVTHRITGLHACKVTQETVNAARGDYSLAGKVSIDAIVAAKGADQVHDILTRAETARYGLLGGKTHDAP